MRILSVTTLPASVSGILTNKTADNIEHRSNKFSWLSTHIRTLLLCFLLFQIGLTTTDAQVSKTLKREEIQVLYLFNFFKFVSWPESSFADADSAFNLCLNGVTGSRKRYNALKTQTAKSRPIKVRYFKSTSDLDNCHIVFVGSKSKIKMADVIEVLADKVTLTVGTHDSFLKNGGMIRLLLSTQQNKLQVNLQNTRKAGLKISANMLEVAEVVE